MGRGDLGNDCYLNEKIWFGSILGQEILTNHLHPCVSKLDLWQNSPLSCIALSTHKDGGEKSRTKLLWHGQLFKAGRGKMKPRSLKDKFEKARTLEKTLLEIRYILDPPVETQIWHFGCFAKGVRKQQNCSSDDVEEASRLLCPCQGISLQIWTPPIVNHP